MKLYSIQEISFILDKHLIYLRLSGERGSAEAQYLIATYYKYGIFVVQDHKKYFDWLLEAASNKDPSAIQEMIVNYKYGYEDLNIKPNENNLNYWKSELDKLGVLEDEK